jgi:general secretion pathway protein F
VPIYEFKGVRRNDGKAVKGLQDADSEKSLRAALKRDGIVVTELREKGQGKARGEVDFSRFFGSRVNKLDIALCTRQLATLTKAGISLVESLSAVIEQMDKPDLKGALTNVRDEVNQGTSLSDAFGKHPKIFDDLYCNMVNAGEQSGNLEAVLARLADFIDAQHRLRSKVFAAMAYPIFMLVVGVLILSVMMVFVVPKVTAIFDNLGQDLPLITQILIFMSNTMKNFWWLMALLAGGAIYAFRRWKSTEKGEYDWHRFILWAPIFGVLAMMIAISRFSKTLATLLSSGVPVLTALDITKGVLGNSVLEKVVVDASSSIREGESIAEPLRASGRFPPIVIHMIAVGERSGQLEEMLENVSIAYDAQVDAKVSALTALLEPVMILVMGVSAGFIVFAILLPLMQMNQFIG